LDADCKTGAYGTQQEAARALAGMLGSLGLLPTWVNSGNGLHVYIILDRPLQKDVWLSAALSLSAHCKSAGLAVDHGVTTDPVRILRYPGTHNRKADPKLVELWGDIRLNETDVVLAALGGAVCSTLPLPPPGVVALASPGGGSSFLGSTKAPMAPSSAARIAELCPQLGAMRDARQARDGLWYQLLGVLAYCVDGDALAQEWSSAHASYTPEETQQKLDRYRAETTGPTKCSTLEQRHPAGCAGCPHKARGVASPVHLGRDVIAGPAEPGETSETLSSPQEVRPPLPRGFSWNPQSQLVRSRLEDETADTVIYGRMLYLDRMTRSELGRGLGCVFRHKATTGWEEFQIPAVVLAGRESRSAFAKYIPAFSESGWRAMTHYIYAAQNMLEPKGYQNLYDQMGYKPSGFRSAAEIKSFVVGNTEYLIDGTTRVAALAEPLRNMAAGMEPRGGRDAWVRAAHCLTPDEMAPHLFTAHLMLGAPLVALTGGGGAIMNHNFSLGLRGTGTGKTFAAIIGLSTWGDPASFSVISSDTANARNRFIAQLCNLPVFWDEFTRQDAEIAQENIMELTLGREKRRSTRDGSLREIENTWNTIILTSGNVSLKDMLGAARGGSEDAAAARVFEYETTKSIYDVKEHLAFARACCANSGWVGREFIAAAVQMGPALEIALATKIGEYQAILNAGPEHRYMIRTMAFMDITFHISAKLGFFQFSPKRMIDWMVGQAREQIERRAEVAAEIAPLAAFLADNQDKILIVASEYRPMSVPTVHVCPKQKIYVRVERNTDTIYIDAAYLRQWMTAKKIDYTTAIRPLWKANVITRKRNITLSAGIPNLQMAQCSVLMVDGRHELLTGVFEREVAVLERGNVVELARNRPGGVAG